ncbi:cadmium-translocating P-type ATPase [Marinicauda salina]|uniref:Cadmium-translocating P-type ATPase n=1 Tax=Marinicauda salina TaxID=2135793 RepID=A0A2U2BWV1_9PROT|nr:heavy metal translocating P-type ATPase [Marinicauda salina]PWE18482.1 cadmium-translocating P-type ATPase [Marinicauda salina]
MADAVIDPVSDTDPAAFVRERDGTKSLDLAVEGARCAGCIAKIEGGLSEMEGVKTARLNLSTGRLAVTFDGAATRANAIVARLRALGYPARPFAPEQTEDATSREEKRLLRAMAVAGFAMANVMLLSIAVWSGEGEMGATTKQFLHWLQGLIALPAAAYAGRPFFESAWRALRSRHVNMDVPISLAVLLACGLSVYETAIGAGDTYFDAAVMLLFFLLIGRYLDSRLRARAGASARRLAAMQASVAYRMAPDGTVSAIPARDVEPGDRLVVGAGDRMPVDGEVIEGRGSVDAALVTGETTPLTLGPGDAVYSGMVNLDAALTIRATAAREDSLLAEIARLVEAGEQKRSSYVRLADHAARLYVPVVHTLALATLVGWIVLTGDVRTAILNAIAVLIITCPCALGLAVPAVQVVACGRLFRENVLVKAGDALERLATSRYAVFDKTGTLTLGKPQLVNADDLPDGALEIAAKLARTSRHPLSRAVADAAGMGDTAADIAEVSGGGIEGRVDGQRVRFGSAGWLDVEAGDGDAALEAWLKIDDAAPIRFVFADRLRADAAEAIAGVKARGLDCELLSGDREAPVRAAAETIGIDRWTAHLKPDEKIARIRDLVEDGLDPVMIGDGLNDAPALAEAHVSISMGSAAEISRSAADLVIQGDKLSAIPVAIDVARASRRRVFENFALAAAYNCIAVPLAVFGFVTPLVAAIAMSGSSLLVTGNALRLAKR